MSLRRDFEIIFLFSLLCIHWKFWNRWLNFLPLNRFISFFKRINIYFNLRNLKLIMSLFFSWWLFFAWLRFIFFHFFLFFLWRDLLTFWKFSAWLFLFMLRRFEWLILCKFTFVDVLHYLLFLWFSFTLYWRLLFWRRNLLILTFLRNFLFLRFFFWYLTFIFLYNWLILNWSLFFRFHAILSLIDYFPYLCLNNLSHFLRFLDTFVNFLLIFYWKRFLLRFLIFDDFRCLYGRRFFIRWFRKIKKNLLVFLFWRPFGFFSIAFFFFR